MKKRLITIILARPWLNLAIIAVATLFFVWQASHLVQDTTLSSFVIRGDPDMAYYNHVRDVFDMDETVLIGFKARDLFGADDLRMIDEISRKIKTMSCVRNVRSLTTVSRIVATEDGFSVESLVPKMPPTTAQVAQIRKEATQNYLFMKDLASPDGKYGAILVETRKTNNPDDIKTLLHSINQILADQHAKTGIAFHMAGDAFINNKLGEYMQRDMATSLALMLCVFFAFLLCITRRMRDVMIALAAVVLSLIWTVGMMAAMGKTLNNVTVGILPLDLCIVLEYLIYVQSGYYENLTANPPRTAMSAALNQMLMPCFIANFTTVIGFASLMTNQIKPLLDFGLVGSLCAIVIYVLDMLLVPSVQMVLRPPARVSRGQNPRFRLNLAPVIASVIRFVEVRGRLFWIIVPVVLALSVIGLVIMRVETDHLTFFHDHSEVNVGTHFVEEHMGGASTLEVTVDTGSLDGVKRPENLREMEKLTAFMRRQPKIDKVLSIADFLKEMNRAMHNNDENFYALPDSKELVAQYLLVYSMSPRRNDVEKDYVDSPYQLARIRCRLSEHKSTAILALLKSIKTYSEQNLPSDLHVRITSYPVIYSNMVESICHSQASGLLFAYILVFLTVTIFVRSLLAGFLIMIPNIIPILWTFGVMGWSGISLNIGTAMTSGIALGMAVDNTIYYFSRFAIEYRRCPDFKQATRRSIAMVGEPMIYSATLMVAGYCVLAFSEFRLMMLFGLLSAQTILVALFCDLYLTPWLVATFKPRFAIGPASRAEREKEPDQPAVLPGVGGGVRAPGVPEWTG